MQCRPPDQVPTNSCIIKVFLAGGIDGCPDWQQNFIDQLEKTFAFKSLCVISPRLDKRLCDDDEQIRWEFNAMKMADVVCFYFPKESLCPISLYELGRYNTLRNLFGSPKLFISAHQDYSCRADVLHQSSLLHDDPVLDSLETLVHVVTDYLNTLLP